MRACDSGVRDSSDLFSVVEEEEENVLFVRTDEPVVDTTAAVM